MGATYGGDESEGTIGAKGRNDGLPFPMTARASEWSDHRRGD